MQRVTAEVAVVGGGPAGLTAAIGLALAGVQTTLVAKGAAAADYRTTFLLASSVTALDTLGVWARGRAHAAPLRVMRMVDDTARLLRAPEVAFAASEIGLEAFGHNIENRFLLAALKARAGELAALTTIEEEADDLEIADGQVTVHCKGGAVVSARLVVAADGRQSRCRSAAGIDLKGRAYQQTALTLNLGHARPHRDTATELHTEAGPFTLVPLPGRRSSLVFVVGTDDAPRLAALADTDMAAEIERRSHSILGKVEVEPGRGVFPLTVETATRFAARRVALIGEAAHVIPPIGAQGLNLGLRDAATIVELVVAAHRDGHGASKDARERAFDIGAEDLTSRYDAMRRADVTSRTLAVDLLNRSLLSDFLPLAAARGLSLFLLDRVGPLRRAALREGVMPLASQPRLMRGEML
jgi:2-octaprenyl-6-methoxyphenol hydroxylase